MYILSILSQAGRYKETQETDTQGEGHVITETETGMSHLQAKELQGLMQPAEARGGREEFFPEPSEGACPSFRGSMSLQTLTSVFQTPESQESTFLLFEATQFVVICHSSPRKLLKHVFQGCDLSLFPYLDKEMKSYGMTETIWIFCSGWHPWLCIRIPWELLRGGGEGPTAQSCTPDQLNQKFWMWGRNITETSPLFNPPWVISMCSWGHKNRWSRWCHPCMIF